MTVFISVVSHAHELLIRDLNCILSLIDNFHVVVKSNKIGDNFGDLLNKTRFHWINDNYNCGFGENNNIVYKYCREFLGMRDDDFFLVVNPDVYVESGQISCLINSMEHDRCSLATINLFKSFKPVIYDYSVREFPSFWGFVRSFLGLGNSTLIDKDNISTSVSVDWAAGSFLMFRSSHYQKLGGFDEKYFMYCEDIDICYRSSLIGTSVVFYPHITALHLAQHSNRNIFSKHFYWHVKSVFRFLLTLKGLTKPRSIIERN